MSSTEKNSARITELELSLMHLQKDFESLSDVVIENGKRLDEVKLLLQRLNDRIDQKAEKPEVRNLEDEKPPHY